MHTFIVPAPWEAEMTRSFESIRSIPPWETQARQAMPRSPAVGKLKQKNYKDQGNLGYTVRPCFKKHKTVPSIVMHTCNSSIQEAVVGG